MVDLDGAVYVRELLDEPEELDFDECEDDVLLDPLEYDRAECKLPLLFKRLAIAVAALKTMIDVIYITCFVFMVCFLPFFVLFSIEPSLICFNYIPGDRRISTQNLENL